MKIVIIGGGFGGIEAARTARENSAEDITLINDTATMAFHAHLHEIVSEKYRADELKLDLKEIMSKYHVDFVEAIVKDITSTHVITNKEKIEYNTLIIALGSKTAFFKCKGVQGKCDLLKQPEHAEKLLMHLKGIKEGNIVIAGAGLTGVELAFEIKTHAKKYKKNLDVHLVEATDTILHGFPKQAQKYATKFLEQEGIIIHTNCKVNKEINHTLTFDNKKKLHYELLIWTAGIKPAINPKKIKLETEYGFIKVDKNLMTSKKGIFAIGDIAWFGTNKHHDPWTATSALYQGKVAGLNAVLYLHKKKLKNYVPGKKHLFLISLGKKTGLLIYGNFCFYGKSILWVKKMFKFWYMHLHT